MKSIKSLDLFSKVSPDHSPSTALGGLVSLFAIAAMTLLFFTELQRYSSERVERVVRVDQDQGAKMMQINFNVTLKAVPCAFVALDHLDVLVDYQEGVRGTVTKRRISKDFKHIAITGRNQFTQAQLKELLDNEEFCILEGTFQVAKVPGYISFIPTNTDSIPNWKQRISFDHTLNHLSFGRLHKHAYINSVFGSGPHTNFSPYDGTSRSINTGAHIYFSKVIPITYIDEEMQDIQHSYHYSMNYNHDSKAAFSYLSLHYDIETVTVTYVLKKFDWLHFAVHLCAALGGMYVIGGMGLRAISFLGWGK